MSVGDVVEHVAVACVTAVEGVLKEGILTTWIRNGMCVSEQRGW